MQFGRYAAFVECLDNYIKLPVFVFIVCKPLSHSLLSPQRHLHISLYPYILQVIKPSFWIVLGIVILNSFPSTSLDISISGYSLNMRTMPEPIPL